MPAAEEAEGLWVLTPPQVPIPDELRERPPSSAKPLLERPPSSPKPAGRAPSSPKPADRAPSKARPEVRAPSVPKPVAREASRPGFAERPELSASDVTLPTETALRRDETQLPKDVVVQVGWNRLNTILLWVLSGLVLVVLAAIGWMLASHA